MIARVLKMGHPVLQQVAQPVSNFATPELETLIEALWASMAEYGGIGIAAPQIGVSQRVVVFGLEEDARAENIPPTVLINPEITPLSDATEYGWEGCLSVPGMRGLVARHTHIRYRGFDAGGQPFECEASDFHARVVQHECDHLDGILYPQRMDDLSNFGFEDELAMRFAPDTEATPGAAEPDAHEA